MDFAEFSSNFNKLLHFPGDPGPVTATLTAAEGESLLALPMDQADVNGDGVLTQRDALEVIDALRAPAGQRVVFWPTDVNRDGRLTAADALVVINRLTTDASVPFTGSDDAGANIDELLLDDAFLDELF